MCGKKMRGGVRSNGSQIQRRRQEEEAARGK